MELYYYLTTVLYSTSTGAPGRMGQGAAPTRHCVTNIRPLLRSPSDVGICVGITHNFVGIVGIVHIFVGITYILVRIVGIVHIFVGITYILVGIVGINFNKTKSS